MKCREVMQPYPYRCGTEETALSCARMMRDQDLRLLPVTDEQDRVLGVVTDRDLVVRLLANDQPSLTKVSTLISTRRLVSCGPDEDLALAIERMSEARLPRILVIDASRRCLGIIGISEVARARGADQVFRLLFAMDSRPDLHPHEAPSPVRATE